MSDEMLGAYLDLYTLQEDERITTIGNTVLRGLTVAVCLEADEPEKLKRYKDKLAKRFPGIQLVGEVKGPVPNVITLKYAKRDSKAN